MSIPLSPLFVACDVVSVERVGVDPNVTSKVGIVVGRGVGRGDGLRVGRGVGGLDSFSSNLSVLVAECVTALEGSDCMPWGVWGNFAFGGAGGSCCPLSSWIWGGDGEERVVSDTRRGRFGDPSLCFRSESSAPKLPARWCSRSARCFSHHTFA